MGADTQIRMLIVGFGLIGVVVLVKNVYLALSSYYQNRQISFIRLSMETRIFDTYLHSNYELHLNSNSAVLAKNIVAEVPQVTLSVLSPALSVAVEGLTAIGIITLLIFVEPIASLTLVIFFGTCGVAYVKLVNPILFKLGNQRSNLQAGTFRIISETLGGIKQIKVFGREKYFRLRFLENTDCARRVSVKAETVQRIPAYLIEFLAVSGLLVVVFTLLSQGRSTQAVVSTLGLFVGASFRLVPSLNRILGASHTLKLGNSAIDIVFNEINRETTYVIAKESVSFDQSLIFDNVSFAYEPQTASVLHNVSFTISAGDAVGIIGTSGAGKTTLVDLLLGLLPPSSGQIEIDGVSVDLHTRSWQTHVGYVPQDIFLVDDTIRNNIAFGVNLQEISEDRIQECIEMSQLSHFIRMLPSGLDSIVGERGVRISGGQRQRIGIARALYNNPALLILDEATSALDLHTETEIVNVLESLHKKVTMIIVSHRISSLKVCDRIFRIEDGILEVLANYKND